MDVLEIVLILLAGVAAGTINTVVGSGTLVTFPTLVAFGYPPVVATMSNAIGQIPGGISGAFGYRRELAGQGRLVRGLLPASLLGAVLGSWLLLHLPPDVFKVVVPFLLVLALVLVVTQPRIQRWVARRAEQGHPPHPRRDRVLLVLGTFLVGVYGGYFTAAQGILLMGVMGLFLTESLQRMNAVKIILSLAVNLVAATAYVIVAWDRIAWAAAGLIAVGTLIGGFVGAAVGRRLPPTALRVCIVALGLIALARLLLV